MVPATRGHGAALSRAATTHPLTTRAAVVLGHARAERLGTLVALSDLVVRNPVVGSSHSLYETCRDDEMTRGQKSRQQHDQEIQQQV